ncbi:MAG TPA: peptide chain release factor N(5)-glutamine methyltransferase [Chthonomonadaceae bacterium]|nr:peptide chain release factor N(5)-glutamine methyltransferase [Chthonomonadaceae bacterium]
MIPDLAEAIATLAAAGIEDPRFEAQILLALALGVSRSQVVAGLAPPPTEAQRQAFLSLVQERARRVPLAYLRGSQEFYGLPFTVTPEVLIPRPETELLVDFALETLRAAETPSPVLADVGTGSGCIAIAVLAHCPPARALAVDISAAALAVAGTNAARNGVTERIRFARAGLLTGLATAHFDLVVSNPPYIPTSEIPKLQEEVRAFEPELALDGGADGLDFHRGLVTGAMRALRPGGWLAVEVAMGQAPVVAALFRQAGLTSIAIRQDLAGIERVVAAKLAPKGQ